MNLWQSFMDAARRGGGALDEMQDGIQDFLWRVIGEGVPAGDGRSQALMEWTYGMEAAAALGVALPVPQMKRTLAHYGEHLDLELLDLICVVRLWQLLPNGQMPAPTRRELIEHIGMHQTPDGGFSERAGASRATMQATFATCAALEALRAALPAARPLVAAIRSLGSATGEYADEHEINLGTTAATACAMLLLQQLGHSAEAATQRWLLARALPNGGFAATASSSLADIRSTALALHALASSQTGHALLDTLREPALDFIDSLWTNKGGFHARWGAEAADAESTFYALVALGDLAER